MARAPAKAKTKAKATSIVMPVALWPERDRQCWFENTATVRGLPILYKLLAQCCEYGVCN